MQIDSRILLQIKGGANGTSFYLKLRKGVEPISMQVSGGHLLIPVCALVSTYIFISCAGDENANRLPYPAP